MHIHMNIYNFLFIIIIIIYLFFKVTIYFMITNNHNNKILLGDYFRLFKLNYYLIPDFLPF